MVSVKYETNPFIFGYVLTMAENMQFNDYGKRVFNVV